MSQLAQQYDGMVALAISNRRNRELVGDLLTGYDLVDIESAVPPETDLCVTDEAGFTRTRDALRGWKGAEEPVYAPVLLLADEDRRDPWARYADEMGSAVDTIVQVPVSRTAVHARIESLLETRGYSEDLAAERRFGERVFETSPVAKTVLDPSGAIVRANDQAEEVLGLSASDITGRSYDDPTWRMLNGEGDPVPDGELPFERVMATGEPIYDEELSIEWPDGQRVWLSVNMAPILDDEGEIEYLVTAMNDITEERRLERELRASEELHRTTLENITDTVVIADEEGAFTYVCPNTEHIFGYTTEEVERLGDIESLLGDDPAPESLAEIGVVENIEREVTDADGQVHVVLVTVKAVSINQGSRLYSVRDITARSRAERALQETMEVRSLALEAADAGVWEWDFEAGELQLDGSLKRMIGLDADDQPNLAELVEDVLHPGDLEAFEAALNDSETDPFSATLRVIREDGEIRWFENRGRTLTDQAGNPERIIGVSLDVTERRNRERELERYERIVETAPDPIYALDSAGEITLANRAFAEVFGADTDEIVGTNITEHMSDESVDASLQHIQQLLESEGTIDPYELTVSTPTGERQFEVNIALHGGLDSDGPPGTIGVARDVTDLREREHRLRRTERAVEASGHAIYITDIDGRIQYANPAFERITGYSREEAVGRNPSILNADERPPAHYDRLWETILDGEVWTEEIVNRRKSGELYHADQTIAPITDEDGELEGFVAIQTDITEHKDRLQHLQVMDRVLRHNLHNALNVVMGHADLIRDAATGRTADDAERIVTKSEELLDLADKQRAITKRLSAEAEATELDLVPTVEQLARSIEERYPEVDLELDLPESAAVEATLDVERAIEELIVNAIEHNDSPSPWVSVAVEQGSDGVVVRVADRGPGIPAMERQVVSGEERIDPLFHGSGLGLWLVSWIVRRTGGTLEFEENDPTGSIVTIRLNPADQP